MSKFWKTITLGTIVILLIMWILLVNCQNNPERAVGKLIHKELQQNEYKLTYKIHCKDSIVERTINIPKEFVFESDSEMIFWMYNIKNK